MTGGAAGAPGGKGGKGGGGGGGGSGGGGGGSGGYVLDRPSAMQFLYQSSWGPTEASIEAVRTQGRDAYLNAQMALNTSGYPEPPDPTISTSFRPAQSAFFANAVQGDDQLRQRMAFFLHQVWVVSARSLPRIQQMVPYMRTLHEHAFSNYRTIMEVMTLSPAMGDYLDMVNNRSAASNGGRAPNENYARELLQLFTVGPLVLNIDGSYKTDRKGNTFPAYTEDTVMDLARVLTGWTYPAAPGATESGCINPGWYEGQMKVRCASRHDTGAKVLMNGYRIPAGLTAEEELQLALDHIFAHPNLGPFVATRMIHHFVTSNPSTSYVKRVAQAFNDNGSGVRGDMAAVLRATLLDREASNTDSMHGRLREPMHYSIALLRAFGATVDWNLNYMDLRNRDMGQEPYKPEDVFSYFHLAHGTFHGDGMMMADGPEFALHTVTNSLARADFAWRLSHDNLGSGVNVDLSEFLTLAESQQHEALLQAVAWRLLPNGSLAAEDVALALPALRSTTFAPTVMRYAIQLVTTPRFQVQP
ncbi:MAG: DUF1800 domain-containing protein [Steroidobacteraceae bacterium]